MSLEKNISVLEGQERLTFKNFSFYIQNYQILCMGLENVSKVVGTNVFSVPVEDDQKSVSGGGKTSEKTHTKIRSNDRIFRKQN